MQGKYGVGGLEVTRESTSGGSSMSLNEDCAWEYENGIDEDISAGMMDNGVGNCDSARAVMWSLTLVILGIKTTSLPMMRCWEIEYK
jgi:hypothetical protein